MVLGNLDLTSLCYMSQTNKQFNNITEDPRLYTCVNVRNVDDEKLTRDIFHYLARKCKYLQHLDLTSSKFDFEDFCEFFNKYGTQLTHLRLNYCKSVTDSVLLKISRTCKNLKGMYVCIYYIYLISN